MTRQDVTYQDKLNELKLDITHPNNAGITFILVEGDSDVRLFRKFFDRQFAKVEEIPGGKIKVEDCVEELIVTYPKVIGLRDADFLHLSSDVYNKPNVYLTDYHDFEMVMIAVDEVFSAVITEYTDILQEKQLQIRNDILQVLEDISLLKWLNDKEDLEITFEGSGFKDLLSFNPFKLDFEEYFTRLLSKSPRARLTSFESIHEKIETLRHSRPNPLYLCNGHDFIKALAQFLKQRGGHRSISDDHISSILRVSFTFHYLTQTRIYQSVTSWAERHNCKIYLN